MRRIIYITLIVAALAGLACQPGDAKTSATSSTNAHMTWGIVTGTLYLNREETKKMAIGSGAAAGLAVFLPPPFDAVVGASGVLLATIAAWADAENKCVKIKSYGDIGIYGPKNKHGRWCR